MLYLKPKLLNVHRTSQAYGNYGNNHCQLLGKLSYYVQIYSTIWHVLMRKRHAAFQSTYLKLTVSTQELITHSATVLTHLRRAPTMQYKWAIRAQWANNSHPKDTSRTFTITHLNTCETITVHCNRTICRQTPDTENGFSCKLTLKSATLLYCTN